jgi:PAS domain S-box-containing protein
MSVYRELLGFLTVPEKERVEVLEVRLALWTRLTKVFLGLGALGIILGCFRTFLEGQWSYLAFYILSYSVLLVITFSKRLFSFRFKTLFLVGSMYVISVVNFTHVGLGGIGMQILVATCVLAAVLMGIRAAFLMLGMGLIAVIAAAAAVTLGGVHISPGLMTTTSASKLAWANAGLFFAIVTTGLIIAPHMFISRLKESLELVEKHSRGLKRSNAILTDQIRTRKKAEKALSGAFDIINRSPAVAFLWKNKEGWPVQFVSENVKELFGYSAEEFMSGQVLYVNTILPEDLPQVLEEVKFFFRDESVERFTIKPYRIVAKDGTVKWVEDRTFVRRDENGRVTHHQGIVEDITERKKAEHALQESNGQFRLIFQTVPDSVSIVRVRDGICLDVNDQFVSETGWKREEVIGKKFKNLNMWCSARDRERMAESLFRSGRIHNLQSVFRMKNGDTITALLSAVSLTIAGEKVIVSITRDITERERAKQALEESEEKYRFVVDNANEWMVLTQDRKIVFANHATIQQSGYSHEEITMRDFSDFIHPDDREIALGRYKSKMNGELKGDHEFRLLCKEKVIWVSISSFPVDWMGRPALLQFMNDITRQKEVEEEKERLQARLQRAQKMEAIGTLAGGVAHDLNNILSGIVSYPDLLLMQLPGDSPLRKPVTTIQQSGKRAAAVVQDLLTLARRGLAVTEPLDLNAMVAEFLRSAELEKLGSGHPHVRLETRLDKTLQNMTGSPVHLQKTLMNLVLNAFEAMPGGGTVTIATENRRLENCLNGYDDVHEGEYVMLSITDTGVGISPEDRERIFEPFYTKKAMGRSGTGLGMAVVWGTIKDHKGYIDVESTVGRGTAFMLYFPATREAAKRVSPVSIDHYQGNGETVMIVDDMEDQREIATTLLSRLGYSVTAVSSGEEAVKRLDKKPVDLLVLDMIMGSGMDGLDTYREIIKTAPSQKAILASGYSETSRVKEAQRLGAGPYIRKPYTLERMGTAVRDELHRRENIAA